MPAPTFPTRPASTATPYRPSYRSACKVAECVYREIERITRDTPPERMTFATMTFPDAVTNKKLASERWKRFRTRHRAAFGLYGVVTWERHKSGVWHLHYVGRLTEPLHGIWRRTPKGPRFFGDLATRRLWKRLNDAAQTCQFGRTQWLPLRNARAGARYAAKYLTKGLAMRRPEDRKARFVSFVGFHRRKIDADGTKYIESDRRTSCAHASNGLAARVFRAQIRAFATRPDFAELTGATRTRDGRPPAAWIHKCRALIRSTAALPDEPPEVREGAGRAVAAYHAPSVNTLRAMGAEDAARELLAEIAAELNAPAHRDAHHLPERSETR